MTDNLVVAGQAADFSTHPNITLMNILSDNWPSGGAAGDEVLKKFHITNVPQGVKIGTEYWDGSTFMQIAVRQGEIVTNTKVIGSTRWSYEDRHEVHIFTKGGSGIDRLWKLGKECMKWLKIYERTPGTGISFMKSSGPKDVTTPEDRRSNQYHAVIYVSLYYDKVLVTS